MKTHATKIGLGLSFLCGFLVLLTSCATTDSDSDPELLIPLQRFEFSSPEMGVPFRMVIYASRPALAAEAAEAAFARIRALNGIFSDYETDSELNRLCQSSGSGRAVPVSEDLWRVLERSQELARRTGGAFDVTIGPCSGLWRKARREQALPEARRLASALARRGHEKLVLDREHRTALLKVPYMQLDLGGIAKGYAVDAALHELRERGLRVALVSGGGDMAMGDPPPGRRGWRVMVAPPEIANTSDARMVEVSNGAVATSGDVFQYLEIDGVRYSHIVDPRTCVGLTNRSQVTVVASDGMTADSLATSLSVLPPAEGLRLVEEQRGAAAHLVRLNQGRLETYESKRLEGYMLK